MKKILLVLLSVLAVGVVALYSLRIYTKSFSPEAEAVYQQNGAKISVKYCRPFKKNRKIFGALVPFGQVWRTGANEATVFTTDKDLKFGDKVLKAGSYSLFSIPQEGNRWIVIFNSETGQWGTNYDETLDVLKVSANAQTGGNTEQLLIDFTGTGAQPSLRILWDDATVSLPMEIL